jgi:hypothetical protein
MLAGLSYSRLADADFAHPTMAEGLSSLFSSVPPRATTVAAALLLISERRPAQEAGDRHRPPHYASNRKVRSIPMAKEKKSARELEAVILDRSLQAGMALQSVRVYPIPDVHCCALRGRFEIGC